MEIVVFRSDIARLVLGYIKNQKLDKAARIFCKTSPHLTEEFSAYKQGLQGYSFFPDLEEIICEYVKITQKVDETLRQLPESLREKLQFKKLSEKVYELLGVALRKILTEKDLSNEENKTIQKSETYCTEDGNTKKLLPSSKRKRLSESTYTSDEQKHEILHKKYRKRRRINEPFCFLGGKRLDLLKKVITSESTSDENSNSSAYISNDAQPARAKEKFDTEQSDDISDIEISDIENPIKESTPRNKFAQTNYQTPSLPEISQAILDNSAFQTKLVENINDALKSATKSNELANVTSETQQILNTNQMLDDMVRNILAATEKDPAFDEIIEEVVGSHKTHVSTAVQCDIEYKSNERNSHSTSNIGASLQMASSHLNTENILSTAKITTQPPHTPLIIRNAVAAGNSIPNNNDIQTLPVLPANTSFGSLIDPNFSISKLIVLNSNDSAQKQHPDSNTAIGNLTADNLLTQLNHNATENTLDDQVHLDVASGQLTFPLFLTNDGLLTNLPFLLNNEIITQQLQSENISNLESSRIEISLPEPIIVKADQLPPNSRISGSTKKLPDVGESLSDINRTNPQKTVSKIKANTVTAVPSSLDSRWHAEKATPSSCGIVNTKAYKSLSTPRKRASHVRTLTFSPKSLTVHTINGLATPLSTRRETVKRLQKSIIENSKADHLVSERPIIKNIEILPRITGGSALDNSANESGNNGNVPPLFVTEECSNQTIIKCEEGKLNIRNIVKEKPKNTNLTKIQSTETPKRRQLRKNAVRACKRQLSKSPKKEILEKIEVANTNENQENTKSTNEDIQNSKIGEKKEDSVDLMEEWLRMRSCTASNLDSRLREINASKGFTKPIKKVTKKKVQRKKETLKAKDKEASNDADESNDKDKVSEAVCSKKEISSVVQVVNTIESQSIEKSQKENQKEKDKKKPPKDKQREFNIKILTPHKSKDKKIEIDLSKSLDKRDNTKSNSLDEKGFIKQSSSNNTCSSNAEECVELEKRTANIACLLETPFKDPNILDGTVIPPTPGIFAHNLDTPLSKMRTTSDNMHTTSFLFGSLTKSELDTPMLSAITPGLRFTPFCSKDATPRSVATTEYSSGGSYYRPDESDELNRNIEKMLKNSAQKQSSDEIQQQSKRIFEADLLDDSGGKDIQCTKHSAVSVEIPAATLKVEPIVLKRVKSFGSDIVTGNDAEIVSKLDPHYTLVCGLPELSAIEDECSSSSSSSSSTTSSSSKSSSSSNTNSTFSSTSGKVSELTLNKISNNLEKAEDNHKSLEQLSEISSAEDEDWQKLVVTDGEDSQLVSNDGEVRYPVRSWLTPNKDKNFSESQTTFKVSLPLMSSEKRNRQLAELEEKRERLKEKLKDDTSKQKKEKVLQSAPGSRAAMAATRSLQAMHKTSCLSTPKSHQVEALKFSNATKISKSPEKVEEPRTIEVLTALQLSAKNEISTSKSSVTKTSTEVTKKSVHITTPKRRKCVEIAAKSLSLLKSQVSATNPRNRANLNRNKTSDAQQKSNLIKDIKRCDRASKLTSIKVKSAKRVSPRLSKLANPESLKITEHPKLLSKNEQSTRKNIQRTSTKTDFDKNKSSSLVIMAMDKRENMENKIKLKENSIERSPNKFNNSCKNTHEEDANAKSNQVSKNCPNQHNNIESKILDEVVLTDSEMLTRNYEKNVEAIEVISCTNSKDEIIAVQPKITAIEDNQTESSEEWVLKSSLDTEKNCFQVLFDESNSQIKVSEKTNDIASFFMGLEIEGQGTHTLRVSEEICLFTLNSNGKEKLPQPIKNIPKKRRMRITTSDDSDGPTKQINPNAKLYISTETANKCIIPNMPQAISTPLPVNRADPQDTQENPKENKSFKSSPVTNSSMYNEPIPTNTEEKIKIDDIENILSQLHGA